MNNSDSYTNKEYVTSSSWPDPVCAMGDYPSYPHLSVPQSTQLDLLSAPGDPPTAGTHIPDFNAADDAEFSLAPELRAFADLIARLDYINQASDQSVESSTLTYLWCHRLVLILGPCQAYVRTFLESALILHIH